MAYSNELYLDSQNKVSSDNCSASYKSLMYLVLDKEADEEQETHWNKHLITCTGCTQQFELEKTIKYKLQNEVKMKSVSGDLIKSIFQIKYKA